MLRSAFKGPYPPSPNKPSTLSPYHPTKDLLSNIRILRDQIANQLQNTKPNQHQKPSNYPGENAKKDKKGWPIQASRVMVIHG